MTTSYLGRENDVDLGEGHSYVPLSFGDDRPFGAILRHSLSPEAFCGTIVLWDTAPYDENAVITCDPPDLTKPLTLSTVLSCTHCGVRGRVNEGRWINDTIQYKL